MRSTRRTGVVTGRASRATEKLRVPWKRRTHLEQQTTEANAMSSRKSYRAYISASFAAEIAAKLKILNLFGAAYCRIIFIQMEYQTT